jgi:hypothetical protein
MDEAIRKFYADLHISIEDQIDTRPDGLTPGQIEAAAEFVYRHGKGIEPLMMAREIRRVARQIDVSKYRGTDQIAREAVREIAKFRKEVENLKGILDGYLNRVENTTWTNRILMIIIVLMLLGILIGVYDGIL